MSRHTAALHAATRSISPSAPSGSRRSPRGARPITASGVLAGPIAADTGWSRSLVYFGFTVSLLVMGAVSTWAGRAIDRHGARAIMTAGTRDRVARPVRALAGEIGVDLPRGVGVARRRHAPVASTTPPSPRWCRSCPRAGRLAISYLTLFGAFASTVFWVVGHYLNEAGGWRQTLVLFAAINLAVCLPLNWIGLARKEAGRQGAPKRRGRDACDRRPAARGQASASWRWRCSRW